MRFRPRQGLLAGVAALAAGAVILDIALTRTCAALLGQHLALAASALALFGAGLGGALLTSLPKLVRRDTLLARMGYLAGLAAAGTLAALLVAVHVRVPEGLGHAAWGPLAAIYLTSALPFLFVSIAVAGAVRNVPALAGRVLFAAFSGAALGSPMALAAVRVGAPRAGLVALLVFAIASLLFYVGAASDRSGTVARPRGALVATFLLAGAVLLAGDIGAPWLKLPYLRFGAIERAEVQEWSVLGLVTVDKPSGGIAWMHTDGTASVPIYTDKTPIPAAPDELAYVLHHDRGPVAVIGGAGGREVRTALKFGQKAVYAIDEDPVTVRTVMQDRYKKQGGDVYDKPEVTVVVDDGRGYVRRGEAQFRSVEIALPDAQVPSGAGVTAMVPNDLYTVEAFADILSHLDPEGTLVLSRYDHELDRLLGLAATALERIGVERPEKNLYACNAGHVTTLLAAKTPLDPREIAQLRRFCSRGNKLSEAYAPDQPHGADRRRFAEGAGPPEPPSGAQAASAPALPDLSAPTGDRPFIGFSTPAAQLLSALRAANATSHAQGLLVLVGLVGASAILLFFAVGLPFSSWPRAPVGRFGPLLFFTALGAALAFAYAALEPRLGTLLGDPLYAFTTVVPAFFASIGVGALLVSRRPRKILLEAAAGRRAAVLVAALAAVAVALGPLVDAGIGLPFGARFAAALVPLVPVGLLGGSLLTLGCRLVTARSAALLPWCLGMGAVGAFAAFAGAGLVVLFLGYSVALLAAGASALLAAVCVPRWR